MRQLPMGILVHTLEDGGYSLELSDYFGGIVSLRFEDFDEAYAIAQHWLDWMYQ